MTKIKKNGDLVKAKNDKNDEFYTQYIDIEKEMQAYLTFNPDIFKGKTVLLPCNDLQYGEFTKYFVKNFKSLGLQKLISTSYIANQSDDIKQAKALILTQENYPDDISSLQKLPWFDLMGDGDFRSEEVTAFRNMADIIITNPPFSLFREFLAWIISGNKCFSIIGNMNALTYKDVFPLIKDNDMWLGATISSGDREFRVPDSYPLNAAGFRVDDEGYKYIRVKGVRWFTNIEHGQRHKPLPLSTMSDNLKKYPKIAQKNAYQPYDNYHAIEIPKTAVIPSDYQGVMGVPISFLDKYNPDQFDILGMDFYVKAGLLADLIAQGWQGKLDRAYLQGHRLYSRVLISHKKQGL